MLRALIVDDEIIVRVGLMSCIRWEDHGYQVVGACESGEEALSVLEELRPDVIFTDIKMPGMDGLELVEQVHRRYPRIRLIILSCLNEIDYVKRAIKLGAEDYILKLSLTPQTLIALLDGMREGILQAREAEGGEEAGESAFEREQAFRMLLSRETFPQQRERLLGKLGLESAEGQRWLTACCLVDSYRQVRSRSSLEDDYLVKYALLNVLREFLGNYPFAEAAALSQSEYLLLVRAGEEELAAGMRDYARRLNDALRTHLGCTVSLGVCGPFGHSRELPDRYETARSLAELRFFEGPACLVEEGRMAVSGQAGRDQPDKGLPRRLQQAVDSLSVERAESCIREWFAGVRSQSGRLLPQAVRAAAVQAWIFVCGYSELAPDQEPQAEEDLFPLLWNAETLEELEERLLQGVGELIDLMARNGSGHPAIRQFRAYLAGHVGENISLTEAAARCSLSRTYFCTLFKKETGESFVDYFSRLKMERARQLLLAGDCKVYEAGNAVGISDMSYFNKLFRKYYNTSPGQLRSGGENSENYSHK